MLKRVLDADCKEEICLSILSALPNWFGIQSAILDYSNTARELPFWAIFDEEEPVAFAALAPHTSFAAEVAVMGVRQEHHRKNMGKRLMHILEEYCKMQGIQLLTVKTLAHTHPDKFYARTREFYYAMGFQPVEVFPTIWGKETPCLLLAKYIKEHQDDSIWASR